MKDLNELSADLSSLRPSCDTAPLINPLPSDPAQRLFQEGTPANSKFLAAKQRMKWAAISTVLGLREEVGSLRAELRFRR